MKGLFAVDVIDYLDRTGNHGVREIRWHPTDRQLDEVVDGECCCEWCMDQVGWQDLSVKMDKDFWAALAPFGEIDRSRY